MRVGLTGKICSGKTTVGHIFTELGANVIDSDRVLKEILQKKSVQEKVETMIGSRIFDKTNWQKILADKLFSDSDLRRRYCSLLYPLTFSKMESLERKDSINIWEVPLLFEAGWHSYMDLIILTVAPSYLRLKRAIMRGMKKDDFKRRDALFLPDEHKIDKCFVIENKGGVKELRRQVFSLWNSINRKE